MEYRSHKHWWYWLGCLCAMTAHCSTSQSPLNQSKVLRCQGASCSYSADQLRSGQDQKESSDQVGSANESAGSSSNGDGSSHPSNPIPLTPTPTQAPGASDVQKEFPNQHAVFVTAHVFSGNLGGLVGADAKCADAAKKAGFAGKWKAILGDATTNAKDRLVLTKVIKNVNGDTLANDAAALWSGALIKAVGYNERLKEVIADYSKDTDGTIDGLGGAAAVWSGTKENGVYETSYFASISNPTRFDCQGWTNDNSGGTKFSGDSGRVNATDKQWSAAKLFFFEEHQCQRQKHLYCISQ